MLEGKVFVVAGASGLIGRGIVDALLEYGALVIAGDLKQSDSMGSSEGNELQSLVFTELDISNSVSINSALDLAEERWGRVDGAVNAAYPRGKNYGRHFFDVEYGDFCNNLSLHLGGYFLFMQQCAKYAKDKETAFSLVNFSSIYGAMAPKFSVYDGTEMTMPVEYAAIKSAILHLNKYVTAWMKGSRFRSNSVSPGGIQNAQDEAFLSSYKAECRSKGMLDVEDIVGTVLFLLSDQSQFVCGQNIIVDDGFSIG